MFMKCCNVMKSVCCNRYDLNVLYSISIHHHPSLSMKAYESWQWIGKSIRKWCIDASRNCWWSIKRFWFRKDRNEIRFDGHVSLEPSKEFGGLYSGMLYTNKPCLYKHVIYMLTLIINRCLPLFPHHTGPKSSSNDCLKWPRSRLSICRSRFTVDWIA